MSPKRQQHDRWIPAPKGRFYIKLDQGGPWPTGVSLAFLKTCPRIQCGLRSRQSIHGWCDTVLSVCPVGQNDRSQAKLNPCMHRTLSPFLLHSSGMSVFSHRSLSLHSFISLCSPDSIICIELSSVLHSFFCYIHSSVEHIL